MASRSYFCLAAAKAIAVKSKVINMEQKKKYKGFYWLLFLVSAAAMTFAICTHWEWLMLLLPFVATSLVKALDVM